MAIIATLRCRNMRQAIQFYTTILDFTRVDGDDEMDDPSFSVLEREGGTLALSSHSGDGVFGAVVAVTTHNVDALFRRLRQRGLQTPGNPDDPKAVHEGPIDQTWGTREFYVEDPDGNTLRFTRGWTLSTISTAAPQFLVDRLEDALAFYEQRLGFARDFVYQNFYASVSRDGAVIHLKCAPKLSAERAHRKTGEHLDAYLAVSGVRDLHDEFVRRGAAILKPLEERPWGARDFYMQDPDGYVLCFSEAV